jgi:uncharacterized protein (TIGR00156 family)
MKKMVLALLTLLSVLAMSQAQTGGGFAGPGANANSATTVKEALKLRDDSIVILQGRIVASLGDEKYTFQDATGSVVVEIDDDDWRGITVTPETTIEITGELDKEVFEATKIDVKSFRVLP